ncbi:hypothetical protein [Anaerobutyricum soehngenii]|uniref:hypothetical protein n=1 Tax=Anaerobutyricum soehngenii TaxID=105843 RepID=UPI001ADDCA5A|nr:hypothetical protein [Anaerobutyricum soehngenii]
MLIRILNTLRSRIWDRVFFLFSDYLNLQLVRMGILDFWIIPSSHQTPILIPI